MADYLKPIPSYDTDTQPFWEGCKAHELRIPRCNHCGEHYYPPRAICPHCLSNDVAYTKVSGRGEVYSMSIIHQNILPGWRDEVPYILAFIKLEEAGVQMLSNVVDVDDPYTVKIGTPVEVVFRDINEEISLPLFTVRQ